SKIIKGPATAQDLRRNRDLPARGFEDLRGGGGRLGMKRIIECIRPEQHAWPTFVFRLPLLKPIPETAMSEAWKTSARTDPSKALHNRANDRSLGQEVREPRKVQRDPGPDVDQSHCKCRDRSRMLFVIMSEKLGLVRRHVDVDGAIALASLASQAKIQGLSDLLAVPAVLDHLAPEHFVKKMGPSASGILLLARDHETRAHGPFIQPPALSDSHAT